MNLIKFLSRSIFVWLAGVAGLVGFLAEAYRRLGQAGALENEAWFVHAVTDVVNQLSQQRKRQIDGAVRVVTGVKGKTHPFNRIGAQNMVQITTRDAATTYSNPPQSKRRAHLNDYAQAVLIDEFDEIKMLANPVSELAQILAFGLERQYDDFVLTPTFTNVGGALGTAETVDEGAETNSPTSFLTAQKIVDGGSGLTMAKIRTSKRLMGEGSVIPEDQYMFYSPKGMEQLLSDPTATSADYSTLNALSSGGFSMDATWYGAKWRESVKLPKAANIRTCIRMQKQGVGLAIGLVKQVELGRDPGHWNNVFAMCKLSGGAVRVDDACVVSVDIDESV